MKLVRVSSKWGDFHALVADNVDDDYLQDTEDQLAIDGVESIGDALEEAMAESDDFFEQLSEVSLFWKRR